MMSNNNYIIQQSNIYCNHTFNKNDKSNEYFKRNEEKKPKHSFQNEKRKSNDSNSSSNDSVVNSSMIDSPCSSFDYNRRKCESTFEHQKTDENKTKSNMITIIFPPRKFTNPLEVQNQIFEHLNKLNQQRYFNCFINSPNSEEYSINFGYWKMMETYNFEIFEFKEILFQLLWILMIAEDKMKFMHLNLSDNCILIKRLKTPVIYYLKNNSKVKDQKRWICHDCEVKICDYEEAQIQITNEKGKEMIIGNTGKEYDEFADRRTIHQLLSDINLPETNDSERTNKRYYEKLKMMLNGDCERYQNMKILVKSQLFSSMRYYRVPENDQYTEYVYEF